MANNDNTLKINTYLVGGAVRDQLLSRPVIERDYVVVGSSIEQMLALGFNQVGRDFPVFLHPKTKEEYALARTERKQGQGYTGFVCHTSPEVTLEQDLLRRDLTVNAMALANDGTLIDPFNGQQDLNNRILRHISPAFVEDPLRVLRVARFAARYHYLGFTVAEETLALMTEISLSGELNALSAERLWKEIERALTEKNPEVFFQLLFDCQALAAIWPSLVSAWQRPLKSSIAGSKDLNQLATAMLQHVVKFTDSAAIRFATLCVALTHGETSQNWSNNAPTTDAKRLVEDIALRLKIPNQTKSLALHAAQYYQQCHNAFSLSAEALLQLFDQLDVWRKPEQFEQLLIVCHAYSDTIDSKNTQSYSQGYYLTSLIALCRNVNATYFIEQGLTGKAIRHAMQQEKLSIIANALQTNNG